MNTYDWSSGATKKANLSLMMIKQCEKGLKKLRNTEEIMSDCINLKKNQCQNILEKKHTASDWHKKLSVFET